MVSFLEGLVSKSLTYSRSLVLSSSPTFEFDYNINPLFPYFPLFRTLYCLVILMSFRNREG
jgi:hypothetical protein